jgi:RNA polymerase sigma-70 factor (ECF subfamily)
MDTWLDLPEKELIKLARAGHTPAYGELVRRCQSPVFNAAYRLCGDREEAADLSQEAFLRAYRSLAAFDTDRPFIPWISRIVTNLALNKIQERRPSVSLEKPWPDSAEAPETMPIADMTAEPERLMLAREQRHTIQEALLTLPPPFRAVIELRHFQELSYEEIAATLNIPLSDVKSNLFRARRLLRIRLGEKI